MLTKDDLLGTHWTKGTNYYLSITHSWSFQCVRENAISGAVWGQWLYILKKIIGKLSPSSGVDERQPASQLDHKYRRENKEKEGQKKPDWKGEEEEGKEESALFLSKRNASYLKHYHVGFRIKARTGQKQLEEEKQGTGDKFTYLTKLWWAKRSQICGTHYGSGKERKSKHFFALCETFLSESQS